MERNFKHLEHFYSANPARRFSPEAGYGVHWRRAGWTGTWRVSYVRDTGEVYALRGGPGDGTLLLLGLFPIDPEAGPRDVYYRGLDRRLEGWPDHCGLPDGLAWLTHRLEHPRSRGGTHIFGLRDEDGAGTALCGALREEVLFLYQIDGTPGRRVSCRECIRLQNQPPEAAWRLDVEAEMGCVCRCCGRRIGEDEPLTGGVCEVRGRSGWRELWTCNDCWNSKKAIVQVPEIPGEKTGENEGGMTP